MKFQISCAFLAAALLATVTSSAFITPSTTFVNSRFAQGHDSFILAANSDGDTGITNGIKVDKSLRSNVSKQNLPPSILPNGGRITMVGSGPGDPDLLTMAAHKLLTDPNVIVMSDRLVSQEILDLIQGEYKIARKLPGCAEEAQAEVCFILFHTIATDVSS